MSNEQSRPASRVGSAHMQALTHSAKLHGSILFVCLALAWCIELVDVVMFGGTLDRFGIRPRRLDALAGILAAPLLHSGWAHLAANSLPFVVLGWLVMLRKVRDFFVVSVVVVVVGGLGVWLIGSANSVHVGASGLIFGYLGYLIARGYFERSFAAVALAVLVAVVYGSVLWGVLPTQRGVSWEGHLFGFIGGVLAARLLVRRRSESGA
jgi:membrane associated rhomboid family serine protease